jgi:hypothetical protein
MGHQKKTSARYVRNLAVATKPKCSSEIQIPVPRNAKALLGIAVAISAPASSISRTFDRARNSCCQETATKVVNTKLLVERLLLDRMTKAAEFFEAHLNQRFMSLVGKAILSTKELLSLRSGAALKIPLEHFIS